MAEINGYLLTEEEEKACENLVKKLFLELGWRLEDKNLVDWSGTVTQTPYFEDDGAEEE